MTTFRAKHVKNYTVVQNSALEDTRLSWKARGLLAYLLSRPDDWKVILGQLVAQSNEDERAAVRTGLAELEKFGYMLRTGLRTSVGKFGGVDYDIYEVPGQTECDNRPRNRVRLSDSGKSHATKYLKEPSTELTNTDENSQIVDMAEVRRRLDEALPGRAAMREASMRHPSAAARPKDSSVTMKAPSRKDRPNG